MYYTDHSQHHLERESSYEVGLTDNDDSCPDTRVALAAREQRDLCVVDHNPESNLDLIEIALRYDGGS